MELKIGKKDFIDINSIDFSNDFNVMSIDFFKINGKVVVWLNEDIISVSKNFTMANKLLNKHFGFKREDRR